MKPVDVISDSHVEYIENLNKKDPKFKIGDHVRISKYKNIFAKRVLQIGRTKFLLLVKLKTQFLGHT